MPYKDREKHLAYHRERQRENREFLKTYFPEKYKAYHKAYNRNLRSQALDSIAKYYHKSKVCFECGSRKVEIHDRLCRGLKSWDKHKRAIDHSEEFLLLCKECHVRIHSWIRESEMFQAVDNLNKKRQGSF